ncbi:MAG: hypothetical protein JOZ69_14065 [Myxococcales bacterium]|nr:hypothetical protein [Myxococcales bacterium]
MQCNVCGGERFTESAYQLDAGAAPALECTHCHALNLDEEAARSEAERDSVRLAVAARARACRTD